MANKQAAWPAAGGYRDGTREPAQAALPRLPLDAAWWSTPTRHLPQETGAQSQVEARNSLMLGDQVLSAVRRRQGTYAVAGARALDELNPAWVENLMGWPGEWTAL